MKQTKKWFYIQASVQSINSEHAIEVKCILHFETYSYHWKINTHLFPEGIEDINDVFALSRQEALFLQNKTVIYLTNHEKNTNLKYIIRSSAPYAKCFVEKRKIVFHG